MYYGIGGGNEPEITVSSNPTEYTKVRIKLSDYDEKFNDDGTMPSYVGDEVHGGHKYKFGDEVVEGNFEFGAALLIVSGSVINAPIPDENGYVEIYVDKSTYHFNTWYAAYYREVNGSEKGVYGGHGGGWLKEYNSEYIFKPIELPNVGTNINNVPAGNYIVEINDTSKQYNSVSKPVTISEAGNQLIEIVLEEVSVHNHTADETEWLSDTYEHWHKCSTCDEDVKLDSEAHTPGAEATETSPQTCTVCGYEIAPKLEHIHDYGNTYKTDADNHWKECRCGDVTERNAHNFVWVTDKEATATEDGSKHEECTVCEYRKKAVTEHVHTYGDTYKTDADNHWKECRCGDVTERDAHNFVWVTDKEATEGQNGSKHEECISCGYKKDVMEIPALKPTEPDTEKPTLKPEPDTKKPEQPTQKPSTPVTGDNISATLLILIITSVVLFGGVIVVGNRKKVSEND